MTYLPANVAGGRTGQADIATIGSHTQGTDDGSKMCLTRPDMQTIHKDSGVCNTPEPLDGKSYWFLTVTYRKRLLSVQRSHHTNSDNPRRGGGARGIITEFSNGSRRRLMQYVNNCDARYRVFITLTYPQDFPVDGPTTKKHLADFCDWIMVNYKRGNSDSLLWVLEFQKRGAPHYHLLFTRFIDCIRVQAAWNACINSYSLASTKIQALRGGTSQVAGYMGKYLRKNDQKQVPPRFSKVGRFWGIRGLRSVETVARAMPIRRLGAYLALFRHVAFSSDNLQIVDYQDIYVALCALNRKGEQELKKIWHYLLGVEKSVDLKELESAGSRLELCSMLPLGC